MTIREWVLEKLKEEPGLGLSLGYLGLTLAGLTYQWELLRRFGANVLDWAEFADFAFASIREPLVLFLSVPAGLGVWLVGSRAKKRAQDPKYTAFNERGTWQYYVGLVCALSLLPLYFSSFVSIFASVVANRIKAGEGQRVTIEYNTNVPGAKPTLSTDPKPLWIGATSRAVFLYDDSKQETVIVPQGSIARIFVEPRTKKKP
jgi:hypothetical protein